MFNYLYSRYITTHKKLSFGIIFQFSLISRNHKINKFEIEGETDTKEGFIMKMIDGLYGSLFVYNTRERRLSMLKSMFLSQIHNGIDKSISDENLSIILNLINKLLDNMSKMTTQYDEYAIEAYSLFGQLCMNTRNSLNPENIRYKVFCENIFPLYGELLDKILNKKLPIGEGEVFDLQNKLYKYTLFLRDSHVYEKAKKYQTMEMGYPVVIIFGSNHKYEGSLKINGVVMSGGFNYKQKYLKYKQKYLELK